MTSSCLFPIRFIPFSWTRRENKRISSRLIILEEAKFECFAIFSKISSSSSSFKPIDLSVRIETKKNEQANYYFFEETLKKKEEKRRRRSSLKPKIEVVDGCLKTVRSDSSACESSFPSLQGVCPLDDPPFLWFEGRKDKRIRSRYREDRSFLSTFCFSNSVNVSEMIQPFHQLCVIILVKRRNWRKIRRRLQRFFNEPVSSCNACRFLLISIGVN